MLVMEIMGIVGVSIVQERTSLSRLAKHIRLLKWAAITIPALLFVVIDYAWERLWPRSDENLADFISAHLVMGFAIAAVAYAIVSYKGRLQQQITQGNRDAAIVEERERTAREMHDGMGQLLGYINTQTIAVRKMLSQGDLAEAREELAKMEDSVRGLYSDVREGILGLRTQAVHADGFLGTIREYVGRYSEMFGIRVAIKVSSVEVCAGLSQSAEIQLTRIIQEALTNVRKHARATQAAVTFQRSGNELCVTVADNGRGFDPSHPPSREWPRFGLQTMQERAQSFGGDLAVESAPGVGCRVSVRVPLTHNAHKKVEV
jgi:signal transduction histidine kinase